MNKLNLIALSIVCLLLASCAPSAVIKIPGDYQARELAILPVQGNVDNSYAEAAFAAARTKSSSYRQLVTLVDVGNNERALNLQLTVENLSDDGSGFLIRDLSFANATVSASLLDASNGAIVSSVTAGGNATAIAGDPPYYDAIRSAVYNAIDEVLRNYANTL